MNIKKFFHSFDFPQYTETFRRIIREKFWLTRGYPAEKFALPQENPGNIWLSANYTVINFSQENPQKAITFPWIIPLYRYAFYQSNLLKTFRGLDSRKLCLSVVQSAESFDFQKTILRKGMSFRGTIHGSFHFYESFAGSFFFFMNISAKSKQNSKIFPGIQQVLFHERKKRPKNLLLQYL